MSLVEAHARLLGVIHRAQADKLARIAAGPLSEWDALPLQRLHEVLRQAALDRRGRSRARGRARALARRLGQGTSSRSWGSRVPAATSLDPLRLGALGAAPWRRVSGSPR